MQSWFTPVDAPEPVSEAALAPVRFIRRNDRKEIRRSLELTCQVVRERDFRLVATRAVDLSPDGMLVPTDTELEPGENLIVTFKATSLGIWFDTEARVARFIRGKRAGDKGTAAGITFSSLDKVKRLILRGHLRRVPPPLPRRAQRIDWAATIRSVST